MKKIYVVSYDNEMENFNRAYATIEQAYAGIQKTVEACRREWENVSYINFKDIRQVNIYLQDDDWEEIVKAKITEMEFEN